MRYKVSVLPILLVVIILSSCSSAVKIFKYNLPDIEDVNRFPTETVKKSSNSFSFHKTENQQLPPSTFWAIGEKVKDGVSTEEFLEKNGTTAFLVVRNDTIVYENYFHGYSRERLSQVFSVTKSVISILVGVAIQEGFIQSTEQLVSDFIPEYKEKGRDNLKIDHLLQMTAGLSFADYKTWGKLLNFYYCSDQEGMVCNLKQKCAPGTKFAYSSIATQILGMCLERATGRKVTDYLHEKLWQPLGAEYDAQFALDDNGDAKMFGGLAASAVDLAKIGRLYMNNGNWNWQQLVSIDWVFASRTADTCDGRSSRYAYCWWLDTYQRKIGYTENDFFAGGYRGQVIYVNPNDNTIIVRLGKKKGGVHWPQSLSKLSLLQEIKSNPELSYDFHALEGKYKSKNGRAFNVKWLNNALVLEGFESSDVERRFELQQASSINFINNDKHLKIVLDNMNHQVRGFLLEVEGGTLFFEKI